MLEARVARLEDDMKEVKASLVEIKAELKHLPRTTDLQGLRNDFSSLRADVAEIKGRLSQMPTLLQLTVVVITPWSAGAAMVFTLLRFARP